MKKLQEDIKTGQFKKAYLLFGKEPYLRQQYKQKLIDVLGMAEDTMNFSRYEGKNIPVPEIIDLCETMPFFAEHRVILIENSGFFKNKCDELADYMKDLPDYMIMIFSEEEADKRSRMYKAVKDIGRTVDFSVQDDKTLAQWSARILANAGRKITSRDMELFLSMSGTEMGNIRMELEKLIAYTQGSDVITAQDIREICTTRTENKIFEMIRAVSDRNQKKAMDLYNDLLTLREPPMRILALMSKQYQQLYMVKAMTAEGLAQKEIAEKMRIRDFAVRNLAYCARAYRESELLEAQQDFAEYEEAVKTGRLQDRLSVELLIVKYSEKQKNS